MNRAQILRRRIHWLTWLFIVGLLVSGATAIPLRWEMTRLTIFVGTEKWIGQTLSAALVEWLFKVLDALDAIETWQPILFYGTDWLAFGHFVIAIAFVGALRDPVRNRWLFDFGLMACALVIPYALVFGGLRGIPIWWRLIDCSFGVFGAVPLWFCRRWVVEVENLIRDKN